MHLLPPYCILFNLRATTLLLLAYVGHSIYVFYCFPLAFIPFEYLERSSYYSSISIVTPEIPSIFSIRLELLFLSDLIYNTYSHSRVSSNGMKEGRSFS